MKIHEYQARELLASYGLPVDKAYICRNVDDAVRAYHELDAPLVVVKAQVHTGGRGKAGGVKLAKDEIELRQHVADILWMAAPRAMTMPNWATMRAIMITMLPRMAICRSGLDATAKAVTAVMARPAVIHM